MLLRRLEASFFGSGSMEKVLLHISRIGSKSSSGIVRELRWGAVATFSHRDKDAVDPDINGHGVQAIVGEKQNAICNLHSTPGKLIRAARSSVVDSLLRLSKLIAPSARMRAVLRRFAAR